MYDIIYIDAVYAPLDTDIEIYDVYRYNYWYPTKESCVVQTTLLAYSLGGAEPLYNNHDSQGLQLLFL